MPPVDFVPDTPAVEAPVASPAATTPTVSIQQAFLEAKAEHSPAPDTPDAPTAVAPSQHPDAPGATPERADVPSDLITDADFSAIQTRFPNDPSKQRAELNRVWTQKTQDLAASRKRLEPYADIIDAFETDTEGTIRALAQQYGVSLAAQTTETPDTTATILKTALGPDLEFLAEKLAPAFEQLVKTVSGKSIADAVGPLAEQQRTLVTRAAQEQTTATMAAFASTHPDWQTHEATMVELGAKLQPNGMSESDYLDTLYVLATRDTSAAATTKKVVARMIKGAETAEPLVRPTAEAQVSTTPRKALTIREAFAEAKREHAQR